MVNLANRAKWVDIRFGDFCSFQDEIPNLLAMEANLNMVGMVPMLGIIREPFDESDVLWLNICIKGCQLLKNLCTFRFSNSLLIRHGLGYFKATNEYRMMHIMAFLGGTRRYVNLDLFMLVHGMCKEVMLGFESSWWSTKLTTHWVVNRIPVMLGDVIL